MSSSKQILIGGVSAVLGFLLIEKLIKKRKKGHDHFERKTPKLHNNSITSQNLKKNLEVKDKNPQFSREGTKRHNRGRRHSRLIFGRQLP